MKRRIFVTLAVIAMPIAAIVGDRVLAQTGGAQRSRQAPIFQVEPGWMKLPNNWVTDVISAVDVDRNDNVWVLHRPAGIPADKKNLAAPPVMEFDATGKFLKSWGGPGHGYDWPGREHALYVDDKDNVWIAGTARPAGGRGTGPSDDYIQKFTMDGKLVMQIGKNGASGGAKDTKNTYGAADLFVYKKTNELIVADEGNVRIMVLDADTGAFKRMWAAFGKEAVDPPAPERGAAGTAAAGAARGRPPQTDGPGPEQFGNTHGARVSNDGLMYVADRANSRVQVFTLAGKYVTQVFINRGASSPDTASGIEFSVDPEQRFLYVSDYGNHHVFVLERKTLEVLYQFGREGTEPGNFRGPHYLAVDSKGNLYVGEVAPGNRLQKFIFKGLGAPPTQ